MNRTAYVINTTPKYFYLLPLHLTLLRRYAGDCPWPVYLATEVDPENPVLQKLCQDFPWLHILSLTQDQEGFLESRQAAAKLLPDTIDYIFPIQEDFLLERYPDWKGIQEALDILERHSTVQSVRLMPCPGPHSDDETFEDTRWKVLKYPTDSYLFTYQATLWRKESYVRFLTSVVETIHRSFGTSLTPSQKVEIQIRMNIAEVEIGQQLLLKQGGLHLAWPRQGSQPNAVYLSPWPYRPTAVVRGKLEQWARELASREGVSLQEPYKI